MLKVQKPESEAADINRPIPALDSVSENYRETIARRDTLTAEVLLLEEEARRLKQDLAQQQKAHLADDRVAALVAGVTYETPAPVLEQLGNIERKKRLLHAALSEIATKLRADHFSASRLVAAEFFPDQMALAREFYMHLVRAIEVHSKLGHLRQRLERSGVDSSSLHDFGREIFGAPNRSDDHAGYALRDGVKRGYITAQACPPNYGVRK